MVKQKKFACMSYEEIKKFEVSTNSVVLYNRNRMLAFQKCKGDDNSIAVIIDGIKEPILLFDNAINDLKAYLNNNF